VDFSNWTSGDTPGINEEESKSSVSQALLRKNDHSKYDFDRNRDYKCEPGWRPSADRPTILPANREFNREFCDFAPSGTLFAPEPAVSPGLFRKIPSGMNGEMVRRNTGSLRNGRQNSTGAPQESEVATRLSPTRGYEGWTPFLELLRWWAESPGRASFWAT
jgi:hypothetical protein